MELCKTSIMSENREISLHWNFTPKSVESFHPMTGSKLKVSSGSTSPQSWMSWCPFFFPKAQLKRGELLEPTCAEDSIMILFSQVWVKIFKTTPRNKQIREKAQSKLRDGELTPCNEVFLFEALSIFSPPTRLIQHLNQQYFPIIWSFVEVMWKIPPTATFTHPASIWNRSLQTLFSYWTCNPHTFKA